jgi:hypothetical protein
MENYLGRVITGPEAVGVSLLIDICVDEMEAFLDRTIEVASFTDTRYLYADPFVPRTYVPLAHSPIATVTSVVVDGVSFTSDQWAIERSGIELLTVNIPQSITGDPPQAVITYTAGLGEPALSQLKNPIINRVARLVNRRRDDVFGARDASIEGYRILYQADEWAERELAIAERWKRRMVSRSPAANDRSTRHYQ